MKTDSKKIRILVSGKRGILSTTVANYLKLKDDIEVEQISLRDALWRKEDFQKYDTIVHIAGLIPKSEIENEEYYQVNVDLTKEFARKAKNDGIKHFIYLSSMSVYGMSQQMQKQRGCITKETSCLPVSDYGKSKLLAEKKLQELEDDFFKVTIIRAPSIYGKGMTAYLEQYRYLNRKFFVLPDVFRKHYKSAIYVDNLSELIYLLIEKKECGIYCPDDGKYASIDYCVMISPKKCKSRIVGFLIEKIFSKNDRIRSYFGAIYYEEELARAFDGTYRVCNIQKAIATSYEAGQF